MNVTFSFYLIQIIPITTSINTRREREETLTMKLKYILSDSFRMSLLMMATLHLHFLAHHGRAMIVVPFRKTDKDGDINLMVLTSKCKIRFSSFTVKLTQ